MQCDICKQTYLLSKPCSWYVIERIANGGSLGSCIDEERSKMRYVMWIADPVNHRIFERKLRCSDEGQHVCMRVACNHEQAWMRLLFPCEDQEWDWLDLVRSCICYVSVNVSLVGWEWGNALKKMRLVTLVDMNVCFGMNIYFDGEGYECWLEPMWFDQCDELVVVDKLLLCIEW
jgi:hypothetical protein